jgi:hypothetical protein
MNRININWEAVVVFLLFMSMNFLPGWLQFPIILINILSFIIFSSILIKISNLRHYNEQKNFVKEFMSRNVGIISLMSLAMFGLLFSIYDLYIYYKNPLRKDFDNIEQQERDKKLKKLGI